MYEIFSGEYYATAEKGVILATLLGSCISVCMKDSFTGVAGINHFMLPGELQKNGIIFQDDARYGISAMEKMINAMIKLGSRREHMKAKVFGGGKVMDTLMNNVAQSNIDFVFSYLEMEEIPVLASSVGGLNGRKIYFSPDTFEIYLKQIYCRNLPDNTFEQEKRFLQQIRESNQKEGDVVFFKKSEKK
jgi:chemotaxis protein CheD